MRGFRTPSYTEVVEEVVADIIRGRAVTAVRVDRRIGKTKLIHVIASKLQDHGRVTVVTDAASATPTKVLRLIGQALRIEGASELKSDSLLGRLAGQEGAERIAVLLDDVELLSPEMFRFLVLLFELLDVPPKKLQFVLIGALGEWPGLQHPDLDIMRQAAFSPYAIFGPPNDDAAAQYRKPDRGSLPRSLEPSNVTIVGRLVHTRINPAPLDASSSSIPEAGSRWRWRWQVFIAAFCTLILAAAVIATTMEVPASSQKLAPVVDTAPSIAPPSISALEEAVTLETSPFLHDEAVAPHTEMTQIPSMPPNMRSLQDGHASQEDAQLDSHEALASKSIPPTTHPDTAALRNRIAQPPAMPVSVQPRPDMHTTPKSTHSRTARHHDTPGLVLIAGASDDLPALYAKVYRGVRPPPYSQVVAANHLPLKPGTLVVFPKPAAGWTLQ